MRLRDSIEIAGRLSAGYDTYNNSPKGNRMQRFSVGAVFCTLPFLLSGNTAGQPAKPKSTPSTPSIDNAAPEKVETATLALG